MEEDDGGALGGTECGGVGPALHSHMKPYAVVSAEHALCSGLEQYFAKPVADANLAVGLHWSQPHEPHSCLGIGCSGGGGSDGEAAGSDGGRGDEAGDVGVGRGGADGDGG